MPEDVADSQPVLRTPITETVPEHYRRMVEDAGEFIFTTDYKGRFNYVNPALGPLLGYTSDEVLGKHFSLFIAPSWRESLVAYYSQQFTERTPKTVMEYQIITRDGEERWVEQTVVLMSENERVAGFLGFLHDISARKRAEEALVAERQMLRTLIDILPDNIFVKDRDSRFVIANIGVTHVNAMNTPDQLIGLSDLDIFPPEIGQEFYADEQKVIQTGTPMIGKEEFNVNPEGIERWFLTTKVPLLDSKGAIIGLVGMSRDITQRKREEEELRRARAELEQRVAERTAELSQANETLKQQIREREQAEAALASERNLLRVLIDNLPDFIYVKDAESRFLLGNAAVARVMGASRPQDLVGRTDFDFYDRDHAVTYDSDEQYVIETGMAIVNKEEPNKDRITGEDLWILTTKVPLRDGAGKVTGLVGIGRNITERKRSEDILRRQQEFLHSIIDINPNLIYIKNADGQFILCNKALADCAGSTVENVIGKTDADFETVESHFRQDDIEVLTTLQPKFIPEETVYHKGSGEFRVYQTMKVPIRSADGSTYQLLGVSTDITERKRAEQQALDLGMERERVQMIADFVRNASHDFRTPLSTINTSAYLLQRITDPDKQHGHIRLIQQQTMHLAKLIEGLLTMTRLDSDIVFKFRPLDLNGLLQLMHGRGNNAAADKQITVSIDLDSAIPRVEADGVELERAIGELLKNAVQYTPAGGAITMRTYMDDGCAVAEISDTGIGIEADDLPHIFERFYRADKSRSTETGGVGLGLCIAQKIVEGHGGRITVESVPRQGSRFQVRLPVADQVKR